MANILVCDDDKEIVDAIEIYLSQDGYQIFKAYDGQQAIEVLKKEDIHLLIMDIMMPKLDGIQVLQTLRAKNVSTPVLLLTAKSQVEDRVAGLDSGADDYLPKPFDNREFIARVRALTRRGGEYTPSILTAGNVSLDCSTFEVKCGSACIRLGNREFQMLELLIRQKGRLISTEQFMEHIWGYDSTAEINVVWAYISYLRRKLEAVGANVRISARRGQGYLLEESP